MSAPPKEFVQFHRCVRNRLAQRLLKQPGPLRVLPPTLKQIVTELERSDDRYRLAARLIPGRNRPQVWAVKDILRRSGFYHDVARNRPPAEIWARVEGHFSKQTTMEQTLLLLDGCSFPFKRLSLFGMHIEKFSREELQRLGPRADVSETFFPRESLDPDWFSQQWFLHYTTTRARQPGDHPFLWEVDLIGENWKPLLVLALYDISFFAVPIWLESQPGWALRRVAWAEPMVDALHDGTEVPAVTYTVEPRRLPQLRRFFRFGEAALTALAGNQRVRLAGRRYLRAMLATGPFPSTASSDDVEEALLQYVFALETLLLSGEREAIADKIALRAGYLFGLDQDDVRKRVFRNAKEMYGQRSGIVHESVSKKPPDLERIRDLTRHVLVAALALRQRVHTDDQWSQALQDLPLVRRIQKQLIDEARKAFALIRESGIKWDS